MSYCYYEQRLTEITDILAMGLETVAPEQAEALKNERKYILHNLRHSESLPTQFK